MGWIEVRADNGSVYYYNAETGQSVLEKPEELFTAMDRFLHMTDWRQNTVEGGRVYYYNIKTQQSVWEVPPEVQKLIDEAKEKEVQTKEDSPIITKKEEEQPTEDKSGKTDVAVLVNPTDKYHNTSQLLSKKISARSPKEAEDIFVEMLREHEVDATWSFSRILDTFIKDPRYWVVDDSLQRKQLFETYLNNRTRDEFMKENMSVEKFKTAFVKLLKDTAEIKYYTRWKTAKLLIQDEPIYAHSVISEKIKKQTFQEYVDELRKTHSAKDSSLRETAMGELREYFRAMNLSISSKWDDTVKSIKEDKRFEQNKHFEAINQLDLITVYEENLKRLQKEFRHQISEQARRNYRSDRIARDSFRELLAELKEGGLLRADTTWEEVYPLINEDDRFVGMLGRNGSTPVELFNDLIEEEELVVRAKKVIVEQVLLHGGYTLKDDVDQEAQKNEVREIIAKDEQTKDFTEDEVDLIYVKLMKDVEEQKEKDRFAEERRLRRAQDSFKAMLHRLSDPPITEKSTWDDVKPRIETEEVYLALPDDEVRKATFEKYVKRLADQKREEDARKDEEVKRIIASATNARKENNERKRPMTVADPVEELDY